MGEGQKRPLEAGFLTIHLLAAASEDLIDGFRFYERQAEGLGAYFLANLFADIDRLAIEGGIHRVVHGRFHRALSRRFPFAIYYAITGGELMIHAVLDCRRDPGWIGRALKRGQPPSSKD